ncbi:hypothetical protein RFI_34940 [Reticulomyxa filosa]|uniref:Peptidase C19 ubiquitin carboxyl-terminal hydrolase domain-containing protein n=1 Tax=Reticulomyxa filosa TaxID=46433 RepID=X6LMB0_RETFI|nr:hypothetical protein RFI_34940 [Reticulomyxa filosa]|eukprot:ETO02491.1 hypothetical protein RFI_34940 [Reticulomyxa filosa]
MNGSPLVNTREFVLRHTYSKGKSYRSQQDKKDDYSGGSSWFREGYEKGKLEQKGVVRFCNLGNTCFMNSIIQYLAQSSYLIHYFINNNLVYHINKDNPLGWKGKVAQA